VSQPGQFRHAPGVEGLGDALRSLDLGSAKPGLVEIPSGSGLNGDGRHDGDVQDVSACWQNRAGELADWAWKRLVNRTDCHGRYYQKNGGVEEATETARPLTLEIVRRHFRATCTEDVIGVHSAVFNGGGSLSKWTCPDIDYHSDRDDADANQRAVVAWYDVLIGRGFHPLLIDSNGRGGYRLYILFAEPVPTSHARRLGLWLVQDWADHGLRGWPEVFPKQFALKPPGSPKGSYGSWARIPGRHHKRDHWPKVWDGSKWVAGDEAIDIIVGTTGDPVDLIPSEANAYVLPETKRTSTSNGAIECGDDAAAPASGKHWVMKAQITSGESARRADGLRGLADEIFEFSHQTTGNRHDYVRDSCVRLASLVKAGGTFTKEKALAGLRGGARANGLEGEGRWDEVLELWESGYDLADPRDLSHLDEDDEDDEEQDSPDPSETVEGDHQCGVNGVVEGSAGPVPAPSPGASSPGGSAPTPSAGASAAAPTRPEIVLTTRRDIAERQTVAVLPNDPELFSRGHVLGIVVEDGGATTTLPGGVVLKGSCARFALLSEAGLSCRLAGLIDFQQVRKSKKGKPVLVPAHPPAYLITAVATRGHWPGVRRLQGIASAPWVRPDGSLPVPGFDPATGTLFKPSVDLAGLLAGLPGSPDQDDARAAADRLFDVVKDFPFAGLDDRAVWLANFLTAVQRPMIAGAVPGFAYNGNIAGVGKELLINCIGVPVWGSSVPARSYPEDVIEAAKIKLSLALAGIAAVHFDNLGEGGRYGSSELDSALTSTIVEGRILGASKESGPVPLRPVWMLSGNNISPSKDAYRRWLPCNLRSKLKDPHERDDLHEIDLKGYVASHRSELLCDALTIVRAHALAGRPVCGKARLGSFEEWDVAIRGAVAFATEGDMGPGIDCLTTQRKAAAESPDQAEKASLIAGWTQLQNLSTDPTAGHTAPEARQLALNISVTYDVLHDALMGMSRDGKMVSAMLIGFKIKAMLDQNINGRKFVRAGEKHGAVLWRVVDAT